MNHIERFHRDDRAQISFLALAAAVCFLGLVSMVMNTSEIVEDRIHIQDVADVTALSSASWTARGLNMVSFINVFNSKLASTAILINALADAIPAIILVGEVQHKIFTGCTGVPFVGAFCAAMAVVVSIQLVALRALLKIVNKMANSLSRCSGKKVLWKLAVSLEKVGKVVKETFAKIGLAEGVSIAKANGATMGIVVSGAMLKVPPESDDLLFSLPVDTTDFKDFCPKMKGGGPGYELQKYECNKGPLRTGQGRIGKIVLLPFRTLFAKEIFDGMVALNSQAAGCTPDPGEKKNRKVQLRDFAECQKYNAKAKWSLLVSETKELTDGTLDVDNFTPWQPQDKDTSDKKAEDKDEILGQIGDINLEDGIGGEDENKPTVQLGDHVKDIDDDDPIINADVNCNSPKFPVHADSGPGFPDGIIIDSCPGSFFNGCERIDKKNDPNSGFTWYSPNNQGQHVKDGPTSIGGYFIRVTRQDKGGDPKKYTYRIETVSMIGAGEKTMNQKQFDQYLKDQGANMEDGGKDIASCTKPKPWMLDVGTTADDRAKFDDKLRFFGLVWKETKDDLPFWSSFFGNPPERLYAYGQAQVYNHLSEDTFTQDWRVRLERATLLETFLEHKSNTSGFKKRIQDAVGIVNNH